MRSTNLRIIIIIKLLNYQNMHVCCESRYWLVNEETFVVLYVRVSVAVGRLHSSAYCLSLWTTEHDSIPAWPQSFSSCQNQGICRTIYSLFSCVVNAANLSSTML